MIEPSVGRVVWYREREGLRLGKQPQAALIAYVHGVTKVNLTVSRPSGETYGVQEVTLWNGEGKEPHTAYCEWMPYQKAVAKGEIAPTLHDNVEAVKRMASAGEPLIDIHKDRS
jgi:hypothetical protein